jgi:hypothetical protein
MIPRVLSVVAMLGALVGCHQQAPDDTRGAAGTSGEAIQSNESAGRMVTPPIGVASARQSIGRQMDVQVDVGRYVNDVAFWSGTPPNDVLAVIDRDLRTADERASGRPARRSMDLPTTGVVTLRGTIEAVPYAEATYGWGLTRVDSARLAEKGVYLRLHEVVR